MYLRQPTLLRTPSQSVSTSIQTTIPETFNKFTQEISASDADFEVSSFLIHLYPYLVHSQADINWKPGNGLKYNQWFTEQKLMSVIRDGVAVLMIDVNIIDSLIDMVIRQAPVQIAYVSPNKTFRWLKQRGFLQHDTTRLTIRKRDKKKGHSKYYAINRNMLSRFVELQTSIGVKKEDESKEESKEIEEQKTQQQNESATSNSNSSQNAMNVENQENINSINRKRKQPDDDITTVTTPIIIQDELDDDDDVVLGTTFADLSVEPPLKKRKM